MISKILVPTDGSKTAQKAVKYAVDLAKQLKASVIALSIIDQRSFGFLGQPVGFLLARLGLLNAALLVPVEGASLDGFPCPRGTIDGRCDFLFWYQCGFCRLVDRFLPSLDQTEMCLGLGEHGLLAGQIGAQFTQRVLRICNHANSRMRAIP